jgi:C-terminal processing protease CtpA/Prc
VSVLADQPRVYARRRFRNGPRPGDFGARIDARFTPEAGGEPFQGPIVVLLGPACVSSGEGMALMLDALPNVRTVGMATRGASGSPAPVPLPNGVEVSFSRWVTERMDGATLEGRGVPPDVPVVHEGPGDPTLAAGLKELQRLLAKPR